MLRKPETDNRVERRGAARGRRRFAVAVLALGAILGIAACGGGGVESGGTSGNVQTVKLQSKPTGSWTISNWPLYIDKNTVSDFDKATGLKIKYIEDVNDNQEFFGKVQPLLAQGESGGRSMFVVTDWMAKKMYDLGYLQNLDKSAIPNVEKNLVPNLQHPTFDPNRDFSVPWQSGMTGVIVRKDLAPDVKSICDLFDPKYKGKVDMLTEMRDTVPLVMKSGCNGNKPVDLNHATEARLADGDRQDQGGRRLRPDPPLHRQRLRPRPDEWGCCRRDRVVRGCGAASSRQPRHRVADAHRGLHALVGQHGDPDRSARTRPRPRRG